MSRKAERNQKTAIFLLGSALFPALAVFLFSLDQPVLAGFMILATVVFWLSSPRWMIIKEKGLPILMFHSVTDDSSWLPWGFLCIRSGLFESMMALLKKKGYYAVSLEDVRKHIRGEHVLQGRPICLTFDDGYLDNWVTACPIMKKYDFSGVVFMSTGFIDPHQEPRPTARDAHSKRANIENRGYLSFSEMRKMEAEKVFDIQCHTREHSWRYTDDVPRTFLAPGDPRLVWNYWNHRSEIKYRWFEEIGGGQELWGWPAMGFARSHFAKKLYFPDQNLLTEMNRFVNENGHESFFKTTDWEARLAAHYEAKKEEFPGRWETDEESEERIRQEFVGSRELLEKELNKKVEFLCWPGEVYDEPRARRALEEFGYIMVSGGAGRNVPGEDPRFFSRIYVKHEYVPFKSRSLNLFLFYSDIKVFEGNYYYFPFVALFNQINKVQRIIFRKAFEAVYSQ